MNERDKELANQAWQQNPGWFDGYVNIQMLINLVRAEEREACAKVCESHGPTLANSAMLADAIRARGNT